MSSNPYAATEFGAALTDAEMVEDPVERYIRLRHLARHPTFRSAPESLRKRLGVLGRKTRDDDAVQG